ncbi:Alpha/Beta hydrolase protein [Dactylonectria macrodidyma]|uniref:Carboxylic ester hydrolase n=1 Tax=Dactylonectria macrodidyma TaxID=307937 RepID=A0A9P9JMJ1_9HYPO|nr:Alpha/Beta hydrolase protein [Dactylonectria macrodidyma]
MKSLDMVLQLVLPVLAVAKGNNYDAPRPTAALDSGAVVGDSVELLDSIAPINRFFGIPYASPPMRFGRAKKPEPWTEPLEATEFGPSCTQLFVTNELGPGVDILKGLFDNSPPESEDCLYLNAFAPTSPQPPEGRPVILFIHGGGWQQGHGRIDMSAFAAYEDIVAFSFNYRTNIFGFPNSPSISTENTNLGLYDQRLAIEWVQANARAFGGDPNKVTIWGQSAGSLSVDVHLNAYGDADQLPFRGAIMSSGQMSVGLLGTTASPWDQGSWDAVAQAVGCNKTNHDHLACMRAVPAADLIDAMSVAQVSFMPITDNITLPSGRAERWRSGENAKVPVLMGTISQEGRALVNRDVDMALFLDSYLMEPLVTREQREAILEVYRADDTLRTDFDVAAAIYTDYFWQCPQGILANISATIGNRSWRFYFNASVTSLFPPEFAWLQKFHGSDAVLLLGAPTLEGNGTGSLPLTPQLYTLGSYLRGVVARFVKNPQGGPGWPGVGSQYSPFDVANLGDVGNEGAVAGPTMVDRRVLDERCRLYEEIYPVLEKYFLV